MPGPTATSTHRDRAHVAVSWSGEQKRAILAEAQGAGTTISAVVWRHGHHPVCCFACDASFWSVCSQHPDRPQIVVREEFCIPLNGVFDCLQISGRRFVVTLQNGFRDSHELAGVNPCSRCDREGGHVGYQRSSDRRYCPESLAHLVGLSGARYWLKR